ncbi:MAG: hypothetical protein OXI87_23730 [Albidovulum sp.]|nr:hypothetical protein [Albidovulum sp.]MDE0307867.1 hypothetical protein [Albidovulum sp.]MDE0533581.1 hypothetical protein [Albidovulum sp.]
MPIPPKPKLLLDQHFRCIDELFGRSTYSELASLFDICGGENRPMARDDFLKELPGVDVIIAAKPTLNRDELSESRALKAIIEVSGTFQDGLDYEFCFKNGIEVLSCSPGFRYAVAEMTLGLILAGCRGIVEEHERFRQNEEHWVDDNIGTDFMLYGQSVGFVGYGEIARECKRLLDPFAPKVKAFDPWIERSGEKLVGVELCDLEYLLSTCRVIVIAATPTDENYKLISRQLVEQIPAGSLVVLASRAHLVDFEALVDAAQDRKIRFAADVFPIEPVEETSRFRSAKNVIWSPHRAAAVEGGRHPIGDMILHDCRNILRGKPNRRLKPATEETVASIFRAPLASRKGGNRVGKR